MAKIILALVLIGAGISKLTRPDLFAGAIDNYRLLPYMAGVLLAYFLPWFEITVGFGLISSRFRSGAALLAIFLFAVFIFALSLALVRGLNIQCGCFGMLEEGGRRSLRWALARSGMGLAAALWIFRANRV